MKIIFCLLFSCMLFAQATKEDIRLILQLNHEQIIEGQVDYLYDKYIDAKQHHISTMLEGCGWAALSGIALGAHESYTFGYTNTSWLIDGLRDWYNWRPNTDAVFGKTFTWQKVWRDIDYAGNTAAINRFKIYYGVKGFFTWQNLYSYVTLFFVKNTFASFVRDKFKHGSYFFSWDLNLIFGIN